ncbi:MAG: 2-polyprenyl-6-methoxyphenol hydroxylase-like FAD-dependent oxidoreductase [Candidatus Azotimanducaceae bacterium]|jgi:2-polyprenyl-6-methoxyphenol hydroxylase-like FAD-dependent oxidoreductase|tara:strand:+ start:456 stop:1514 length:1059 start_codon:yes stop_codon:yes gene_type:complete
MNTVLRDVDVMVVGGDAIGLFFALRAAQRFMQVVLVGRSEALDDDVVQLSIETQRIFGAAGLAEALRSITEVTTWGVRHSALMSMLEDAASDAGVRVMSDVCLQSFKIADDGESVSVALGDPTGATRSCTTRWLVGTDATVREQLDVDVDEINGVSTAAQFRAGPVFLVGSGACFGSPDASDALARGLGDAANLAWRLQAVHQGHARDRLLDAYDAERRPAARSAAAGTHAPLPGVGQLVGSHSLIGHPLVPVVIEGRPLESRLSQGWAILTSDIGLIRHDLLARWIGIGTRIVMLGESLGEVVGAPREGMVIVRPDGVVAAVALDGDAFGDASEQLLGWYADGEPVGTAPG